MEYGWLVGKYDILVMHQDTWAVAAEACPLVRLGARCRGHGEIGLPDGDNRPGQ